jgi:hypothetical protein
VFNLKTLLLVAAAGLALLAIANSKDIERYMKIRSM